MHRNLLFLTGLALTLLALAAASVHLLFERIGGELCFPTRPTLADIVVSDEATMLIESQQYPAETAVFLVQRLLQRSQQRAYALGFCWRGRLLLTGGDPGRLLLAVHQVDAQRRSTIRILTVVEWQTETGQVLPSTPTEIFEER